MRRSAFIQCLAGSAMFAQQPASIKVSVNEVIVPITVTDAKGKFVTDLKEEDFKIYDEGKLQKIREATGSAAARAELEEMKRQMNNQAQKNVEKTM